MKQIQPMTSAPAQTQDDGGEISLLALVRTLVSEWPWLVATALVAGVIGTFLALRQPAVYQAVGLLQLEQKQNALALPEGMQDLFGTDASKSASETQMSIMQSRMVLGQAVRTLDLEVFAEPRQLPILGQLPVKLQLPAPGFLTAYRWGDESLTIDRFEVPQKWLGEEMWLQVTGPSGYALTLPDGTRVEGEIGKELRAAGTLALTVATIDAPVGREFLVGRRSLDTTIGMVAQNFSVSESPRGSSILRTSYTDTDRDRAESVLNAIADAFLRQNVERNAASAESSLAFIEGQLPQARKTVTDAEQALNAYREQQQSVDVDYETQSLLERVTRIEGDLSALDLKEAELKNQYTVNHPAYQALLQNRKELQAQLEAARRATQSLPETQKDIFNLQRNLDVAQQVYVQLLNRSQELQVLRASTVGSVRVIDEAFADTQPIAPRMGRIVALALLLGLMLGSAAVLLRRAMRRGIKGAEEIETLGLPVFATVPFAPEAANLREKRGELPIFAMAHPNDVVTEALRSLRTSLHFGLLDAPTNSIQITSAAPNVGKSFTAVNLAIVAAQAGQKVCLIDADMRRGYMRRFFGLGKQAPGLSDYLGKEKSLAEVIVAGPVDGLDVIVAGRYPPNPSELLMRAEFPEMLQELDAKYDLIVIDSPPALAVTDPVVIGRSVGASIVIARHIETMLGELRAVQAAFGTAGGKVNGAVLNGFKASAAERYGGHYHYHYNYRYSYKSNE